jgi:uncharacterized protein (DUF1499 family)
MSNLNRFNGSRTLDAVCEEGLNEYITHRRRIIATVIVMFWTFLFITACTGMKPDHLGIRNERLAPCPSSPNCVSSDAQDEDHYTAPYRLRIEPVKAWQILQDIVISLPRTRIDQVTEEYLHAEARSRIFRFVDDIEFHLRPDQKIIAVRSASRIGYSDLGVNRKRVDRIRELLRSREVLE